MIRLLKYAALLAALLIGALLAAPFVIDVNDYRDEIGRRVEQATGRAFTIGSIRASLFPWIGLELKDVRMANAAGFSRPDFLRAGELQIQVEVMPLLDREVVIRSLRLVAPQIFLERNARGEGNWRDLTGSGGAPAPAASTHAPVRGAPQAGRGAAGAHAHGAGLLRRLAARAIVIERGHLAWRDAEGRGLDVGDLQLEIHDLQQERPVPFALSATVAGNTVQLDGRLGPLGSLESLDPARIPLQLHLQAQAVALTSFRSFTGPLPDALGGEPVAAVDLKLEQRPDGMRVCAGSLGLSSGGAPARFARMNASWQAEINSSFDLQLRSASLSLDGKQLIQLNGTVTGLTGHPRARLRLKSAALSREWLAGYLPALKQLYAAHPDPWRTVQFGALVRGDADKVAFEDLQLLLNGEVLQGEGSWRGGKEPAVHLLLAGRTLHLDPWLPQPKPSEQGDATPVAPPEPAGGALIGGKGTAKAPANSAEPDLRGFANWQIDARLTIDTLTVHKLEMQHLQLTAKGRRGRYRLDPLRFNLAGGKVEERASIDIKRYPLAWTESLHLRGVRVLPVLFALADTDLLDGTVEMETSLNGRGAVAERAASRLNGKGRLKIRDGRIKGIDIAGTLRNLTTFGQQHGPKQTDFSTLSGSFTIANGLLDNRDLFIASPLFRLTGHGTVDLAAKRLDYHAKPKLVGTLTGQGDTLPVRKGLAVPLHITGSFDKPRITPEIDPMTLINSVGGLLKGGASGVGSVIKGAGQGAGKLIEGVTGGIGAGVGGVLGAVLGGGQGRQPEAGTRQGARIEPKPKAAPGPARIAPRIQPKKPQPATLPPAIGDLLQGF